MNHQPFRDWLLSDEELSATQHQVLQEHLSSCESCQQVKVSWQEVESAFIKAPMIQLQPGFTQRWQMNLMTHQQRRQRQRGILSVGLVSLLAAGSLALLLYLLWSIFQNPGPYLALWFEQLVRLFSLFSLARQIVSPYTAVTPVLAFFSAIFLVGWISFISVGWLATYRKLSLARRTV